MRANELDQVEPAQTEAESTNCSLGPTRVQSSIFNTAPSDAFGVAHFTSC